MASVEVGTRRSNFAQYWTWSMNWVSFIHIRHDIHHLKFMLSCLPSWLVYSWSTLESIKLTVNFCIWHATRYHSTYDRKGPIYRLRHTSTTFSTCLSLSVSQKISGHLTRSPSILIRMTLVSASLPGVFFGKVTGQTSVNKSLKLILRVLVGYLSALFISAT